MEYSFKHATIVQPVEHYIGNAQISLEKKYSALKETTSVSSRNQKCRGPEFESQLWLYAK
jgi:hypothetical protein